MTKKQLFDPSAICAQIRSIPQGHMEPETAKEIVAALAASIKKGRGAAHGVDTWWFHAADMLNDVNKTIDFYNDEETEE